MVALIAELVVVMLPELVVALSGFSNYSFSWLFRISLFLSGGYKADCMEFAISSFVVYSRDYYGICCVILSGNVLGK